MLNQVILVGRLVEIKEEGKKAIITLAVPQSFQNVDGEYDTNYIECILFGSVAKNTIEYCKKGDVIGIKGRIQRLGEEPMGIIAEKVTFLASSKGE